MVIKRIAKRRPQKSLPYPKSKLCTMVIWGSNMRRQLTNRWSISTKAITNILAPMLWYQTSEPMPSSVAISSLKKIASRTRPQKRTGKEKWKSCLGTGTLSCSHWSLAWGATESHQSPCPCGEACMSSRITITRHWRRDRVVLPPCLVSNT